MGNYFFTEFRTNGGPTLYSELKTPVTADVLEAGLIFAAVILFVSLLFIIPGIHSHLGKVFAAIKMFLGVFITASILLCNFGQEWEVSHVRTLTQYRAGLLEEIVANIEVKIGLRSVNITLLVDGETVVFNSTGMEITERINYNERFSWDNIGFVQGRAGFGPFAGKLNQEYRAAQFKGVPYPILWIAEYFTLDGEWIRWGRFYRQAGYYTHICMWLAFPLWCLSMIMMKMVIRYGGYLSFFTGLVLITANIIFATVRNPNALVIPVGEKFLHFKWGWSFILNLVTGFMCIIIGVIIFIVDLRASEKLAEFFGVDLFNDYDEIYSTQDDLNVVVRAAGKSKIKNDNTVADAHDEDYEDTEVSRPTVPTRQFRKRSTAFTKKFQKKTKVPLPPPNQNIELTERQKKYHHEINPRTQSIPEDNEVFHDDGTYELSEPGHDQRSFQFRPGSGPMDNNL